MNDETRRSELIALIVKDYAATRSLIDGVVRTSIALRGVGMTLTLALLGYAVAHPSIIVAVLALLTTWLFLYLDAYHGWLYDEGRRRARDVEHVLRLRYRQVERGDDDPDAEDDLDRALGKHKLGQYLALPRFRYTYLLRARPRMVYVMVYGSLTLLACGAVVYAAVK